MLRKRLIDEVKTVLLVRRLTELMRIIKEEPCPTLKDRFIKDFRFLVHELNKRTNVH